MIEAVIFDLDGVLISTDDLHYKAWKALADRLEIHNFNRLDNERQKGVSRMASLEVVLAKGNKDYNAKEKQQMAEEKNRLYVQSLDDLGDEALLPGALKALNDLRDIGVKIALGSASKNAPLILEKVGIEAYFDAIACGHDTSKSKPDPEVFLVAAKKLGIEPEKCLVVEDSRVGVQAALAGNMSVIAIGSAGEEPGASEVLQNLADEGLNWSRLLK